MAIEWSLENVRRSDNLFYPYEGTDWFGKPESGVRMYAIVSVLINDAASCGITTLTCENAQEFYERVCVLQWKFKVLRNEDGSVASIPKRWVLRLVGLQVSGRHVRYFADHDDFMRFYFDDDPEFLALVLSKQ